MEYHDFIWDVYGLKRFYETVLYPLKDTEVFFVSMSARTKRMPPEDRLLYNLGRTEMFERRIIRKNDWENFYRTILKYNLPHKAYTGKTGIPIPQEYLSIYFNINPSNMLLAYKEFQDIMNENLCNLASDRGSSTEWTKRIDRELMNTVQRCRGTKHYIDIDIDFYNEKKYTVDGLRAINSIIDIFKNKKLQFFVLSTRSGYHILLKKESITFNYNECIDTIAIVYNGIIKEISKNSNEMIPLPGTLAAGHKTHIIYDSSNF